jgi:RNA polymerase sigma-70 factor (ECF subfamily)
VVRCDNVPDCVLIERSLAYDELALAALYRRYDDYIRRAIVSFGTDFDEMDDCAQETWIRVIRGLPNFRGTARFDVWLWRIAKNIVAERRRSQSRRLRASKTVPSLGRTTDQPLETKAIVDAVRSIPPRMRVVLLLAAEGYTHSEIAVRLGISEGTSKSQLNKARAKVRSELA